MKSKHILIIMIIFAILLMLQIIAMPSVHGLKISEIMFNPEGADTGREWIEIEINETDGCINLTSYKLYEEGTNHNIYSNGEDLACKYAIVSNNINAFFEDYAYLNKSYDSENMNNYTIYKSSFSLANTGEELALKKDSNIIDYVNYSMILQAVTVLEGYSLEYRSDAWRQSIEPNGTPGNVFIEIAPNNNNNNNNTNNETNQNTDLNTTNNITNNNTDNISETDIIENTTINISNNTASNITTNVTTNSNNNTTLNNTINNTNNITNNIDTNTSTNLTNNNNTNNNSINNSINNTNNTNNSNNNNSTNNNNILNNSCLVSIRTYIKDEKQTYNNSDTIKFQNKLELSNRSDKLSDKILNYTIEYWVEDYFGNIIKNKIETYNQDEKTFTPKIDESDKILIIKSRIKEINFKDVKCKINSSQDEKIVLILYNNYQKPLCPICIATQSKTSSSSNKITPIENNVPCSVNDIQPTKILQTISVCNYSEKSVNSLQDNLQSQNITSTQIISSTQSPAQISNNSQSQTGKITNMIVYESPNLKNRAYALIGLIIVCLTSLAFIIYKWRSNMKSS